MRARTRLLLPLLTAAALTCGAAVTAGYAATPAGTVHPDAGTGYWHTSGNKILDSAGNQVRIAGINWYGFETPDMVAHGLWSVDYKTIVDDIKQTGYNTIRIPFSNQMVESPVVPQNIGFYGNGGPINTDLQGLNSLQILDKIISYAGQDGLKVILDDHRSEAGESAEQNGLWYTSAYPQSAWVNDWVTMAHRYANNPTVIGADLRNEPHTPAGVAYANGATWGTGTATDFRLACQTAGNAILAVQPNWLIMVEGIGEFQNADGSIDSTWWGGDLQGVASFPVQLNVANRVVYSPHDYGPDEFQQTWFNSSTTPASLDAVWDKYWGYVSNSGTAPIWVGEFGVPNSDAGTTAAGSEGQWFSSLVSYIKATPAMGWTYWALNGEDRYGLLDGSYSITSASATKQALLASIQFPLTGTTTSSSPTPTGTGTGTGAPPPPGGCSAAYSVTNSWPTGYTASVTVTNKGAAISHWTVTFTLPSGQTVSNGWSGTFTQSGSTVTVKDAGYNGSVAANGTLNFGFQASDSGTAGTASSFTLNGTACS